MALFDSHCHLESGKFEPDREAVIARAYAAGVTRLLSCGSDLATSRDEVALAHSHTGLYAAVGIHGHEAKTAVLGDAGGDWTLDEAVFAALTGLAREPEVVALGEIGLDYHYDFSPRPVQRAVLARQLALAGELGLPVILHSRESDEDLRQIVEAAPSGLRGVLHCFLSDQRMADWALARGFYLGVAGPVTFQKMDALHAVLRQVPPERLLIETDSPYLAPGPKRGQRNEPAHVAYVAAGLAGVLGMPVEELAERSSANARRLFGV